MTKFFNLRFVTSQEGLYAGFTGSVNPLKLYVKFVMYRYMCGIKMGWVVTSVT